MSEMPNNMGISRFTNEGLISIGEMAAVAPTIKSELKILLPTTLPTANPDVPLRAETKLTQNSGSEVPKATTVRPIMICGTLRRVAMELAPSVKRSAPQTTATIPRTMKIISTITWFLLWGIDCKDTTSGDEKQTIALFCLCFKLYFCTKIARQRLRVLPKIVKKRCRRYPALR